jgi:PST family polysaccharide transporter
MVVISKQRLFNIINHRLVQNALSLYGVQIASYILPLITIPYLARVLGVAGWGLVAFAQSFASFTILAVEYGFNLSGTREVARHRDNCQKQAEIFAGVLGAKGLIACASLAVAWLVCPRVSIFRSHHDLLWAGMFWALPQAFNVMWYFQGLERLRLVATLDITAKVMATVAIFFVVRKPDDDWLVLIAQGSAYSFSFFVGLGLAYRNLPFRLPTWGATWKALSMGWTMFLFRTSVSLYTVANSFILGLLVSPQSVGYFAGAEKIVRALLQLFNPITQTLYPRVSHLVQHDRDRAARLARFGTLILGTSGAVLGAVTFMFAPQIVRFALGGAFVPAVPVLRVLSFLLPLIGLNTAVGPQWMLPLGLDRSFNRIILLAGLINIGLASALARPYAGLGMAIAVVSAELFIGVRVHLALHRRHLHPLAYTAKISNEIGRRGTLIEVMELSIPACGSTEKIL